MNQENQLNKTRKKVAEPLVFQGLLGWMKRRVINVTSIIPDCFRTEPQMKAKSDDVDVEEAKGSITEAIGKITANPSTEIKGTEMKKAARQRKASDIASDASVGNAKS